MQLPDRTLVLVDEILDDLEYDRAPNESVLEELRDIVDDYMPPSDQIFIRGKYTDFEALLFATNHIKELQVELGTKASEIDELKHSFGKLKQELNNVQNMSKADRQAVVKDKAMKTLEKSNAKLSKENAQLRQMNNRLLSIKYVSEKFKEEHGK